MLPYVETKPKHKCLQCCFLIENENLGFVLSMKQVYWPKSVPSICLMPNWILNYSFYQSLPYFWMLNFPAEKLSWLYLLSSHPYVTKSLPNKLCSFSWEDVFFPVVLVEWWNSSQSWNLDTISIWVDTQRNYLHGLKS